MANEWFEIADSNHFWLKWRFDALRRLSSHLPAAGARILEIGCGSGIFLHQLNSLDRGYELHGCDLNSLALERAALVPATLYTYDIQELDEDFAEAFDAVFLMDVIEHILIDRDFLAAAVFHLKPGGSVFLNVPAYQWLYSRYDEAAGHERRYTRASLNSLIRAAGLVDEKIVSWGFSLLPLACVRKLILPFVSKEQVIEVGFRPPNQASAFFLDSLRILELKSPIEIPWGTSLLAVASKPCEFS